MVFTFPVLGYSFSTRKGRACRRVFRKQFPWWALLIGEQSLFCQGRFQQLSQEARNCDATQMRPERHHQQPNSYLGVLTFVLGAWGEGTSCSISSRRCPLVLNIVLASIDDWSGPTPEPLIYHLLMAINYISIEKVLLSNQFELHLLLVPC